MAEGLADIPFGIDDIGVIEAFLALPETCRSCPNVIELLARVSMSCTRSKSLGVEVLGDHEKFILADTISDLLFMGDTARSRGCKGPKKPIGDTNSSRWDCPEQWVVGAGNSGAHYGLDAHVVFNRFVEAEKPTPGYS